MSERFEPGQPVLMRHVRGSYNWCAPMRVVEDRGDFVALYLKPGSTYARMVHEDSGELTRDFTKGTSTAETTWGIHHALHLVRFGDEHATILFWAVDSWEFRCWYLNFQEPLRRFARGFESMDLTLDTLISPDRTAWQWKDEDEFVEFGIAGGWYTPEQLAHLKQYGERVVAQALTGEPPFADGWEHWRPPPEWGPLALPADWRE